MTALPPTRRDVLRLGSIGLGAAVWRHPLGRDRPGDATPHHPPRARSLILLHMDGGPSQVDTFDPKPRLAAENGQPFKMRIEPTQFNDIGATLQPPWRFRRYGESGIPVSDLFPNVARCVDRLAVIRSMSAPFSEHTNANYFLHAGVGLQGRPSLGAWWVYGLGSDCRDLPGYVD
jgi:hypothetical protein